MPSSWVEPWTSTCSSKPLALEPLSVLPIWGPSTYPMRPRLEGGPGALLRVAGAWMISTAHPPVSAPTQVPSQTVSSLYSGRPCPHVAEDGQRVRGPARVTSRLSPVISKGHGPLVSGRRQAEGGAQRKAVTLRDRTVCLWATLGHHSAFGLSLYLGHRGRMPADS